MDEQERAERLAEAIDRIVLGGGEIEPEDVELAPFLALAADLHRAMPPVRANPEFETSLRARLLTGARVPRWRRVLNGVMALFRRVPHPDPLPKGEGEDTLPLGEGRGEGRRAGPAWVYAAGLAAVALMAATVFLALEGLPSRQTITTQAQSAQPSVPTAAAGLIADAPIAAASAATAPPQAAEVPSPAILSGQRAAVAPTPAPPSLPPLSATVPRMAVGGLGGGYDPGSTGPTRQIRFELATSLPNLGAIATVYRYRLPAQDPEAARRLAARLEFDPASVRSIAGAEGSYVVSDEIGRSLEIQGPDGPIAYHADIGGKESVPGAPRPLPENSLVADEATRWLADRGLLPADAGNPRVAVPFPEAPFQEVNLRPAEPANIVTPHPEVRLGLGADGSVANLFMLWPRLESTLSYPARTADSAWELLRSEKGEMRFEGEHNRPDFHGVVRIDSVEIGYALTFALDDRPYLQPVVVFRGTSSMEGDPQPRPFSGWVPMVADSSLSREEIRYLLSGPLPKTPTEAPLIEREAAEEPTAGSVRELGRKLGLSGEPRLMGKDGPPGMRPFWQMGDPSGEWLLQVAADLKALGGWSELWSFGATRPMEGAEGRSRKAPEGEAAIRIAEEFLKVRSLYTPDLGRPRAEMASPDGSATIVIFQGDVEGLAIRDGGVMAILMNADGGVQRVMSNQHPVKVVRRGRLLTPEQALEAIEAGKGRLEVPLLPGRTVYSDRAEIERVELAYRLQMPEMRAPGPGPSLSGPPPQRYEPHYLFSGTMEVGESKKRVPFTVSLPAWAP